MSWLWSEPLSTRCKRQASLNLHLSILWITLFLVSYVSCLFFFFILVDKIYVILLFWCRLVLDTDNTPMVLPFVHTGMQDVMPIGANFPRIGKTVCSLSTLSDSVFISFKTCTPQSSLACHKNGMMIRFPLSHCPFLSLAFFGLGTLSFVLSYT